jgi:hypothetical protein
MFQNASPPEATFKWVKNRKLCGTALAENGKLCGDVRRNLSNCAVFCAADLVELCEIKVVRLIVLGEASCKGYKYLDPALMNVHWVLEV